MASDCFYFFPFTPAMNCPSSPAGWPSGFDGSQWTWCGAASPAANRPSSGHHGHQAAEQGKREVTCGADGDGQASRVVRRVAPTHSGHRHDPAEVPQIDQHETDGRLLRLRKSAGRPGVDDGDCHAHRSQDCQRRDRPDDGGHLSANNPPQTRAVSVVTMNIDRRLNWNGRRPISGPRPAGELPPGPRVGGADGPPHANRSSRRQNEHEPRPSRWPP